MQKNPYFPQASKLQFCNTVDGGCCGADADTRSVSSGHSTSSSSIVSDVLAQVQNERLMDCELVSNSGEHFPACRFVLAARSSVLRHQLFPRRNHGRRRRPKNTSSSDDDDDLSLFQLQIPHSSTVVQALLEYCQTDALVEYLQGNVVTEGTVREWVSLHTCAHAYKLPGLQQLVEQVAQSTFLPPSSSQSQSKTVSSFSNNFPLACALLDECMGQQDSASTMVLQQIAWQAIRTDPALALLGVQYCTETTLHHILQDPNLECPELVLFQALQVWLTSHTTSHDSSLIDCLDLTRLAPSELVGPVRQSGLVDEDQISDALSTIAQRMEQNGHLSLPERRGGGYCHPPRKSILFPDDPMASVIVQQQESSSSKNNNNMSNNNEIIKSPRLVQQERPRAGRASPTSVVTPMTTTPSKEQSGSKEHASTTKPAYSKDNGHADNNSLTGNEQEQTEPADESKGYFRRHFDKVAESLDLVCQHGCMTMTTVSQ
jgi:hypothetical protein